MSRLMSPPMVSREVAKWLRNLRPNPLVVAEVTISRELADKLSEIPREELEAFIRDRFIDAALAGAE